MYSDDDAARLYDVLNPWQAADDFYLPIVMAASSVLDIGCGTGTLLEAARRAGHDGRLVGVDPDTAMLRVAADRDDIEWVHGDAASLSADAEFELATMTGHAFQCLVSDGELRASLAAVRRALVPGGRFVFETRNPEARAWEAWAAMEPIAVTDHRGRELRIGYDVLDVTGDVVEFTENTMASDGSVLRIDRARLRFLAVDRLGDFLAAAGFAVEAQYGDWAGSPLRPGSPEIITRAVAAG